MKYKALIALSLGLFVYLQFRLWFGPGSLEEITSLKRQLAQLEAEVARLQSQNGRLRSEVRYLKRGLDGVEDRARSELGMIREGETFYLIVEPEDDKKPGQ